jgi:Flp pilus assembly protein TadD
MSLINDMLKDLEKRPQLALAADNPVAGLRSNLSHGNNRNRKYYIIIGILMLILAFTSSLLFPGATKDVAKPDSDNANQLMQQSAPEIAPPQGVVDPGLLTGVALQIQTGLSTLRILLTQETLYQVSSNDEEHEITIIFENTHLLAPLPKINYSGSGIEDVQTMADGQNDLKMVIHLAQTTEVKRLELGKDIKAPELELDIASRNPTQKTANAAPVAIKKPVPESNLEQRYQYALRLADTSQVPAAIETLSLLLNEFPSYTEARESLVALLIQQGDKNTALKALDVGLGLQPNFPDFVKLKARILLEQGKLDSALSLLEFKAPSILNDPEYHALRAALYQQKGQDILAGDIYKQLLVIQPSNAKWWVGLGVALEGSGNRSQALEAFTNADSIGGLSPELKAYLDSQLNAL